MSNQLLASKIVIQEEEPQVRPIDGVTTNITGFCGVTERGPIGLGPILSSPEDYRKAYGGYVANGDVAQAIDGFFQNGGQQCYVARICHFTDVADPTTLTAVKGHTADILDHAGSPIATIKFNAKTEGAWANSFGVKVTAPTNGVTGYFNAEVQKNGVTVEVWPNLSMTNADARYVETIVNDADTGSLYVTAVDLASATAAPADWPAVGTYALTTGADGLGSLADNDFVGGSGTNGRTGLRAFDTVIDLRLLVVPGRATATVHQGMLTYCETLRTGSVFAILDPPSGTSASSMVTYVKTTASLTNLSEYGAIYWPRIKVANPSTSVFGAGTTITVAPSGHIAGVYARVDGARDGGIYDAPAGASKGILRNCQGFETDECLLEDKLDLVYPERINPLTTLPGLPRYIDGSRTLKGNGNFPSVSERRGVIFVEQSIKAALQVVRHRNNDELLRAEVTRAVTGFLTLQMKNRAFRTQDPSTAFYVDFGPGLNPPAVTFAGKLVGKIGLATQKPAEYVILRFAQDTRSLAA